ncbi:MAG: LpxI family protein [Endomicrobiia bacterium]
MENIGLITGKGNLPILLAKNIRENYKETKIFAIGFSGETNKKIKKYSDEFKIVPFGSFGKLVEYFKFKNVKKTLMAGLVNHRKLFDKNVKLDEHAKKIFENIKDNKADSILSSIAEELEKNKIELMPMLDFIKSSIAEEGFLTKTQPDQLQIQDIEFGFEIAKELSKLDIGQTIVVKNKCIVAVESIEGTDLCLLRAGKLAKENTVVLKIAKFHQDPRFDLPIIGPKTIKIMKRIKSKVLAIESGKTCIIDKEQTIKLADKYGISIVGLKR